jgi:hypothetical protein
MQKICGNCKFFNNYGIDYGHCEQIDACYEVSTNSPKASVMRFSNQHCINNKAHNIFFEPKNSLSNNPVEEQKSK